MSHILKIFNCPWIFAPLSCNLKMLYFNRLIPLDHVTFVSPVKLIVFSIYIASILLIQQTSPQRIPASVAPPTLLTPQAFRQRAQSDAPTAAPGPSGNPLQLLSAAMSSSGPSTGGGLLPLRTPMQVDTLTKEQFQDAFVHLIRVCIKFKLFGLHHHFVLL